MVLKFREKLHSIPVQPDYSVLCSQLALETSFARFFTKFVRRTASTCAHGDDLAEFYIEDFPYVMNNCHTRKEEMEMKVETFQLFIQIDRRGNFKGHRLWKACIGERELTAEEAYLFMSTYLFGTAHVQIRALANWGVIPHKFENPFLRRMSVITVMYNYYGFTFFTRIILFLQFFFKPFTHLHRKVNVKPEFERCTSSVLHYSLLDEVGLMCHLIRSGSIT